MTIRATKVKVASDDVHTTITSGHCTAKNSACSAPRAWPIPSPGAARSPDQSDDEDSQSQMKGRA